MKTLFVYCSSDDAINSLCRESAFKRQETQLLELEGFSGKSALRKFIDCKKDSRNSYVHSVKKDTYEFDRIILACDELAGEISPVVSDFIRNNDFRYKTVDCIVFGTGKTAKKAEDNLKIKVSLSGGTVRSCVNVSRYELKKEQEDILFSLRHRMAV